MQHKNFFSYQIRVYIEDTDAGGIVYHANHIKYMERVRTEWLRSQGIDHYLARNISTHGNDIRSQAEQNLPNSSFSFVVHQLQITYHQPAVMNDLLIISLQAVSCGAASFVLNQNIEREDIINGVTKRVNIASAHVKLACLNATLKPRRLPSDIRGLIQTALLD